MEVIGISGKLTAGKDAIAARLVERWGFTVVRFSGPLKEELLARLPRTLLAFHAQTCPCSDGVEHVREMVYETKPPGVRELLQEYGTEVRRADDPNYWTKRWAERADAHDRVVVPDVRFENEAAAVLGRGGRLWRVERPGTAAGDHSSEVLLDGPREWDAVLHNVGSLADLWAQVDELMESAAAPAA